MKAKGFSKKYPKTHPGPRYGPLFRAVRAWPCWLEIQRYGGGGHPSCGPGVQGGHTAHHVGRNDEEGLIPGCGLAHDLLAGLGGNATRKEFEAWLERFGFDLKEVGMQFVERVRDGRPHPASDFEN